MTGIDKLGFANTAGAEAHIYPVVPLVQRFHQEGVIDTILVAYDEPETDEMIPVGRVVTSPDEHTITSGGEDYTSSTSRVQGLAGDAVVLDRLNKVYHYEKFDLASHRNRWLERNPEQLAVNLVELQTEAAHLVLAHFGYQIKKARSINVFTELLKRARI